MLSNSFNITITIRKNPRKVVISISYKKGWIIKFNINAPLIHPKPNKLD